MSEVGIIKLLAVLTLGLILSQHAPAQSNVWETLSPVRMVKTTKTTERVEKRAKRHECQRSIAFETVGDLKNPCKSMEWEENHQKGLR